MDNGVKQTAIKFGLIVGGLSVAYILIGYSFDLELLVNRLLASVLLVVNITLLVLAVISQKKSNGGFISLRAAFSTFFLAYLVSAVMNITFTYTLFGLVDTDAAAELKEITIESNLELYESFGTPEEVIEEQIAILESVDQYSLKTLLTGTGIMMIFVSLVAFIVAIAVRKNEPIVFEETTEEA